MKFELAPLPFAKDALEPHISARTVEFHYEKHHRGYLNKLDQALEGDDRRELSLQDIIAGSDGKVFNCAAQVWNHDFYWQSIDPTGKSEPSEALGALLESSFDGIEAAKAALKAAGAGEFGSGWAWLCYDPAQRTLTVTSTTDAENPIPANVTPLLTIDVWEHAYYLDWQNNRGGYLNAILENLINWEFASANLAKATA